MFHMITDNIQAYRMAVSATTHAQCVSRLNPLGKNIDELVNCEADEQLKLDGLMNIIGIAIRQAAAQPPHNPFSINGDVNQPSSVMCNNTMMSEPDTNEHGTFPPPPKRDQ